MTDNIREEIRVTGEQLLQQVRTLLHEGNVRSITIKDNKGVTVLMLPLTVGVIGVALAPMLAAVGAAAALLTECTISVERRPETPPAP
ncbi:MAG TPA: DUF4342 domain-containing protein [Armatimonadota bacterium]|nr:DUF4342 domain-containing protein [Armatimonadota bacterium]